MPAVEQRIPIIRELSGEICITVIRTTD
ncbi:uncharacterized protein METZ01_LOCUS470960, partial [marine metagenome]